MRDQAGLWGGRVRGLHRDGLQDEQGDQQGGASQHQRLSCPRGQHARLDHRHVSQHVSFMWHFQASP